MIDKQGLDEILHFVSKRWVDITRDEKNKAFESLPSGFWMNATGGKAGTGRWVTMLMYTEDTAEAESFKEVLLRWQAKHSAKQQDSSDFIQINKK
ncbi:MAG: hypothetical protein HY295_00365 [Thaumarchaeota archaeon]|nr:hypothetical protein [Nitrososphaerota archaeon]